MNEYFFEDGINFDPQPLQTGHVSKSDYSIAHKMMAFTCHDIAVEKDGRYLFVKRTVKPAVNIFKPIGGRIARGVPIEESLRLKVKAEADIDIYDIKLLGFARTGFRTDPFEHGFGTDTINFIYTARTDDTIVLDGNHVDPKMFTLEELAVMSNDLHPYVQYVVELLNKK